jgi:hypothetical protein
VERLGWSSWHPADPKRLELAASEAQDQFLGFTSFTPDSVRNKVQRPLSFSRRCRLASWIAGRRLPS